MNTVNWNDKYTKYKNKVMIKSQTLMTQQWFYDISEEIKWEKFILKAKELFGLINNE